jgi:hypothetical protein
LLFAIGCCSFVTVTFTLRFVIVTLFLFVTFVDLLLVDWFSGCLLRLRSCVVCLAFVVLLFGCYDLLFVGCYVVTLDLHSVTVRCSFVRYCVYVLFPFLRCLLFTFVVTLRFSCPWFVVVGFVGDARFVVVDCWYCVVVVVLLVRLLVLFVVAGVYDWLMIYYYLVLLLIVIVNGYLMMTLISIYCSVWCWWYCYYCCIVICCLTLLLLIVLCCLHLLF